MVQYLDPKGKGFIEVTFTGDDYLTSLNQKEHLSDREIEDYWIIAKLANRTQNGLYTHQEDFEKMKQPFPIDSRGTVRRLFEQGYIEIVE